MSSDVPEQVISVVIVPPEVPNTRARQTSLEPGAEYGNLPFDRFVLKNWDYSLPEYQDQEQWNDLARKWLAMENTERHKHAEGFPEETPPADAPYLASQDQVRKIFTPHQSIKERNLAQNVNSNGGSDPIWLRTHYSAESDAVFAKMIEDALEHKPDEPDPVLVLDHEADYGNLGNDWTRVFFRIPFSVESLPFDDNDKRVHDFYMAQSIEDLPTEESHKPIGRASLHERLVVYLFDEQAIREQRVKIMFVDTHGKLLWWNTLEAKFLDNFHAIYARGGMISRIMENLGGEDDPLLKPGAPLNWDW